MKKDVERFFLQFAYVCNSKNEKEMNSVQDSWYRYFHPFSLKLKVPLPHVVEEKSQQREIPENSEKMSC